MGAARKPERVKLIVGVLTATPSLLDRVKPKLETHFGATDTESALIPFTATDYYKEDMGDNLLRRFYSFKKLVEADALPDIKQWTNDVERNFAGAEGTTVSRPVNLDPGYVTLAKLILASTKDYSHRVYIGKGIYGEVTLTWARNTFSFREWTYPDFKSREYIDFFNKVRRIFAEQVASKE